MGKTITAAALTFSTKGRRAMPLAVQLLTATQCAKKADAAWQLRAYTDKRTFLSNALNHRLQEVQRRTVFTDRLLQEYGMTHDPDDDTDLLPSPSAVHRASE